MRKINFTQLRVITLLGGLVLVSLLGSAQTPVTPPAAYDVNIKTNYIRTWDAMAPETDANTLMTRSLQDVKQTTQYFDGLGRPLQTVIKQGSLPTGGTPVDMVSAVVYDEFGREQYKYLPSPANNTGGNTSISDGLFKFNPFQQQASFYGDPNGILKGQNETFFYGQSKFEASPLNRIEESFAPGNSWAGTSTDANEADRRSVKAKYLFNTTTDDVKIWNVADVANSFGTYSMAGAYSADELYKNITVDEHGKQVVEFKDKEGKVILKKVQLTATADNGGGSGYTGWLCTYYIYDVLTNLRAVIQPEGVKYLFTNNWPALTTTILNEQCFRYEYDQRNRMIKKKVPGAGEVNLVYDARDRLVMTQDANMRPANKWLVTKYDAFNRPIETGLWVDATVFTTHLTNAYTSTIYPVTSTDYEELTKTFYDDYSWLAINGNPFSQNRYTADDAIFYPPSFTDFPYPQPLTQSFQTRGSVTGTKIKVLGTSQYLYSINYYDEKGRVIQIYSQNTTGGGTILTSQYSFAGQTLISYQLNVNNQNSQTVGVRCLYNYDDLGRVLNVKKIVYTSFGVNTAEKTIIENEYDALGQLKKKKLAPAYNNNAGLETENYDYNIRGWMLGMNRDYAKDANNTNYFGFDLGYDKANNSIIGNQTYANPQFNGNIEGMVWKSKGDGEKRKYDFYYDAANRLLKGDFKQFTSGTFTLADVNFSMQMGDGVDPGSAYDENGNIKAMKQWGLKIAGSSVIDDLNYTYYDNSNKLKNVVDQQSDPQTKLGDFRYSSLYNTALGGTKTNAATDYTYDDNGNLKKDHNKDIGDGGNDGIVYNHLNLPQTITVRTTNGGIKGTITYTYDAAGNKLKKEINETGQPLKTTLYLGGAVYENDVLQFIGHEEGRIRFKAANGSIPASFQFDYIIKDHLGNVRMVLTEEQQQDIYPASTLEGSQVATDKSMLNYEKGFYTIDNNFITDKTSIPSWTAGLNYENNNGNPPPNSSYPADHIVNSTAISDKLYKLNATANKTGLGLVIKVMAGDKVDIHGKSYYNSTQTFTNSNSTQLILTDIINAFLGTPNNAGAAKGVTSSQMEGWNAGSIPGDFIRGSNGETTAIPKAYINFLFFDEQFRYAGTGGASRVGASGAVKSHWFVDGVLQNITAPKNGYLYVYVSNESNVDVFFDNLQVMHTRGPLLEETHYYPFGLTMAGISSKTLEFGGLENKKRFNGYELQNKEFSDGSGLEWYDYKNRFYDDQIGRFFVQDRLASDYVVYSPYQFAGNEVPNVIDLDGLEPYADFRINRDVQDVRSGKITIDQLNERLEVRGKADLIAVGAGLAIGLGGNLIPATLLRFGLIGSIVNTTFSVLQGENGYEVFKSAASGFFSGIVLGGLGGTSIKAILTAGAASGAAGEAVNQAIDNIFGKKQGFDFNKILISGGVGALANVISNAVVNKTSQVLDKLLSTEIASTKTAMYRETIKKAILEESPNMGTRALNKAANQRIKEAQQLLRKQNDLNKAAVKQAIERGIDYIQEQIGQ